MPCFPAVGRPSALENQEVPFRHMERKIKRVQIISLLIAVSGFIGLALEAFTHGLERPQAAIVLGLCCGLGLLLNAVLALFRLNLSRAAKARKEADSHSPSSSRERA